MLVLDCPTQAYDWGSVDDIPGFQRRNGDGTPVAEVWIGTHPLGTATVAGPVHTGRPLSEVAGEMGLMLKVLAANRPLSIQVHPNAARARAGFEAENAAGIAPTAPERVFKDPHPKPEMVYALSTFDSLVGFRPTAEILRVLLPLQHPVTSALAKNLRRNPGFAGIVRLVEGLLLDPPSADEVKQVVELCHDALAEGIDIKRAYATAIEIERSHPGDVGVVISLLLNRLTLQPGEAAFLDTGIIHAHLSGMCLEVMVSSDNVLRAGLTSKHVDPTGLVRCLEEGMSRVARVTPQLFGTSTDVFAPSRDFALSITQSSQAEPAGVVLPAQGQRLFVCTGGEVALINAREEMIHLRRGDAGFADDTDGEIRVIGTGEVAQAFAPSGAAGRLDDLI
ncbi:mannose-6-phosphate isomerase, class I [Nocardioides sp. zg-536]|uniref:mannose-6-phosphate isomerase n=1 Tax=Nocardioides faecalis TaxID=2803858 RepID=A0A938Y1V4_9ACTN|nr:mannose-6-phosphate isomerase, class I [Nocardioides faecalis]MBM9458373.1 mannose-6-phosphate isomerase, class I [Nocardioides faecalis]QVI58393.1 mannose-6-phosphate isomerase, class I [Nocardioides faecalis]